MLPALVQIFFKRGNRRLCISENNLGEVLCNPFNTRIWVCKYYIMKRILLLIMPVVLITLAFRPVKSHTVSGTVTDEKGNPLSSVNIKVKGTSQGTFTDAAGKYSITIAVGNGT